MKNLEFRTLRADEIEVRPQSVKNGKATMLLYIDSRAVVSLLNETVGNMNWTSEFYEANGQMIGKIAIYDEDRDIWVSKSDTGSAFIGFYPADDPDIAFSGFVEKGEYSKLMIREIIEAYYDKDYHIEKLSGRSEEDIAAELSDNDSYDEYEEDYED